MRTGSGPKEALHKLSVTLSRTVANHAPNPGHPGEIRDPVLERPADAGFPPLAPGFRPNPYPQIGPLDTGGDRRQRSQRRQASEGREQEERKNQQEATEKTEKIFSVFCNSSSVPSVASCSISYFGSSQRPGCGIREIRGQMGQFAPGFLIRSRCPALGLVGKAKGFRRGDVVPVEFFDSLESRHPMLEHQHCSSILHLGPGFRTTWSASTPWLVGSRASMG